MIVAKYIGDIGAVGARAAALGSTAGHTLGKKKLAKPPPLISSNTGLPGAFKAPPPRGSPVSDVARLATTLAPAPTSTILSKRNNAPPASSSSSSSSSSGPGASAYYQAPARTGPTSSPGSGTPWPIDTPIASSGGPVDDVPVKDAYVSVSGGIPDGAVYAIMAATAGALAYVLWRRSKRR